MNGIMSTVSGCDIVGLKATALIIPISACAYLELRSATTI